MTVLSAVSDGWRRVVRAPMLVLGIWVVYFLVPSPVFVDVADAQVALGESGAMDPGPVLLSLVASAPGALAHVTLLTFLLGGFLDRLARDRAVGAFGFFGAAGMYFFRFLRLGAIAVLVNMALLLWLAPMIETGGAPATLLVAALVFAVNVVFDYAKVRMVVEDRRSALGSLRAALRFASRNALAVVVLSLLFSGLLAGAWYFAASNATVPGAAVSFSLARGVLRLAFAASLIALFQSRLAHAGYTARPLATWPESAAAERVQGAGASD